jgi:hypothetical protein
MSSEKNKFLQNKIKKDTQVSNFSRLSGASGVKGTHSFYGLTNGANNLLHFMK